MIYDTLAHRAQYYGLGERFSPFVKNGQVVVQLESRKRFLIIFR